MIYEAFLKTLDPEVRSTWERILVQSLDAAQAATGLRREDIEGIALRDAMTQFATVAEYRDGKWVERERPRAA
jgi:hypothetical protein